MDPCDSDTYSNALDRGAYADLCIAADIISQLLLMVGPSKNKGIAPGRVWYSLRYGVANSSRRGASRRASINISAQAPGASSF